MSPISTLNNKLQVELHSLVLVKSDYGGKVPCGGKFPPPHHGIGIVWNLIEVEPRGS